MTQLYKWMLPNLSTAVKKKPWPVAVGEWTNVVATDLCRSGWHGVEEKDVLHHLPTKVGASLWVVEVRGTILHGDDKFCAPQMKLVRELGATTDRNLRLFAADCAQDVLPLFWKVAPNDQRPAQAIAVARRYAEGQATNKERDAARAAAGDAARDAFWAAAWDTAWAAAGAAARDAAWAAAGDAAGAAAGAAAGDAAGDAAWDAAWAAAGDAARAAAGAAAGDAARAAAGDAARAKYSNWLVARIESDE
jgi:hypothetical protein